MITAIVVTFNRLDKLKVTIEKTLAQEKLQALLIIDNASTDGTGKWLDTVNDERVIVHHSLENEGGAGGFSRGMQLALEKTSSKWFVLYDDDAYPLENAFAEFIDQSKNNDFDGAAAAVYYPNGEICEMNRPSWDPFRHPKKLRQTLLSALGIGKKKDAFHMLNSGYQSGQIMAIDSSSFVGFFIKREWVQKLPALNPNLFIYGDDMFYSLTFTKKGGKHVFLPKVGFNHDCTAIQKTSQTIYKPMWKAYFAYRNGLILYRNISGNWFYLVCLFKIMQWGFAVFKYENKRLYLNLVMQSCIDGFKQNLSKKPIEIIKIFL